VEHFDLHSPNIIWVIKWIGMRWVGHLACMVERSGAYRVLVGNLRERNHFQKTQA
jgi:hypothetical protein